MVTRPDILIRKHNDLPVALVEVKNPRDWPESYAIEMRRNMIIHEILPSVPYFLLISQRKGFVWRQEDDLVGDAPDREPDAEFPMGHIVARYAPEELSGGWLRGSELEYIVVRWLDDLASGTKHGEDEAERVLNEIGFIQAIKDASVLPEAVL